MLLLKFIDPAPLPPLKQHPTIHPCTKKAETLSS
jgi:hypothetical protein